MARGTHPALVAGAYDTRARSGWGAARGPTEAVFATARSYRCQVLVAGISGQLAQHDSASLHVLSPVHAVQEAAFS